MTAKADDNGTNVLPENFTGEAILVLDRNHRVLGFNDLAQHLLRSGLAPGERVSLEELFEGPDLAKVMSSLDQALSRGGSSQRLAARAIDSQGIGFDCIFSINPLVGINQLVTGVIISIRDAESLPLMAQNRPDRATDFPSLPALTYESLVEHLAEGIFTINTRWQITSFNQTAEKITGYKRGEVLGRYCWEIFRSDVCQSGCPLRMTLESGITRFDQDVRMLDKKGARMPMLVNTNVVRDRTGRVIGAVETFRLIGSLEEQPGFPSRPLTFSEIVGRGPAMQRLFKLLPAVAASEANVLIQGESGTGKELVARAIHHHSSFREGPFVAVNCSALAETLLESELFGHEKAAFTGAIRSKVGRFELARRGTLFLDEIGELKPELQVKLLRVLEQRVFERVGGTRLIPMEARIISATNRDLIKALAEGQFREDLFYRLRTVPIILPPLRERLEDIPLLVEHFLARLNRKYKKEVRGVDPKVMRPFLSYPWPGNVRELERILEYAFVFVKGPVIFQRHLPNLELLMKERLPENKKAETKKETQAPAGDLLREALEKSGGRRLEAADLLGISRTSLWRKMKKMGLE
ncbi:MAG: sigma 54-interacting transcriptional regulator [Deltaproteobacteria bacterium]|nr:sigma 54-interacting transcriptional regulator [Deltaproteobacteria bacterium]